MMVKPYCHFGRYLAKDTREQWEEGHKYVHPHVWNRELRAVTRKELGPIGRKLWGEEEDGLRNAPDISYGLTK